MGSSNIRDILTSFSPALDYLAISTGDGRIKIWDTVKGQVQTEFADIMSAEETNIYTKAERGHLSMDYTCMKWLSLDKKKKRKLGISLLLLGTGGGDVLALDVAAGQLKWRVSDCHPGGVNSVSFSSNASCIFSGGADGMICEIDPHSGNPLRKFKASTKAISCLSVSSDGKVLATASSLMKTFSCSDHKKIQKFTGHPGAVRCMIFTEDGKYILSSAVGERYIAVWKTDGAKKQSARCVLAMEHPAVFLDSRCTNSEEVDKKGLYVLAISEVGVSYFWYGANIEELCNAKATKVSLSIQESHKGALPTIFATKLQDVVKPGFVHAFIAFGLLVKPSFQNMLLQFGTDLILSTSQDGVLLPITRSVSKPKKGRDVQSKVTALDRAYAEDAMLPIPRVADLHEKKDMKQDFDSEIKDHAIEMETDSDTFCMEDRLRSLGILGSTDELISSNLSASAVIEGIDLEANMQQKKIRSVVLSMEPSDAYKTLETLVALWQTRSCGGKHLLPWMYNILVNHSQHIMSQEQKNQQMLNALHKITKSRGMATQQLLQLSGRLQLVAAQIDKAAPRGSRQGLSQNQQMDESEEEDEAIDGHLYGDEDNESELSSDDEN